MTHITSLRKDIDRAEYEIRSAEVAGAIAQRLLAGGALRLSRPARPRRRPSVVSRSARQ